MSSEHGSDGHVSTKSSDSSASAVAGQSLAGNWGDRRNGSRKRGGGSNKRGRQRNGSTQSERAATAATSAAADKPALADTAANTHGDERRSSGLPRPAARTWDAERAQLWQQFIVERREGLSGIQDLQKLDRNWAYRTGPYPIGSTARAPFYNSDRFANYCGFRSGKEVCAMRIVAARQHKLCLFDEIPTSGIDDFRVLVAREREAHFVGIGDALSGIGGELPVFKPVPKTSTGLRGGATVASVSQGNTAGNADSVSGSGGSLQQAEPEPRSEMARHAPLAMDYPGQQPDSAGSGPVLVPAGGTSTGRSRVDPQSLRTDHAAPHEQHDSTSPPRQEGLGQCGPVPAEARLHDTSPVLPFHFGTLDTGDGGILREDQLQFIFGASESVETERGLHDPRDKGKAKTDIITTEGLVDCTQLDALLSGDEKVAGDVQGVRHPLQSETSFQEPVAKALPSPDSAGPANYLFSTGPGPFSPSGPVRTPPTVQPGGAPQLPPVQQPVALPPAPVDMTRVVIPRNVTQKMYDELASVFPDFNIVATGPARASTHLLARLYRELAIHKVLATLPPQTLVRAIGAIPGHVRHQHLNTIWYSSREYAATDTTRNFGGDSCDCRPSKCQHFNETVILLVDRIYYLEAGKIAGWLKTGKRVLSIHQVFTNHRGGLYCADGKPEFQYQRDASGGVIVSEVRGRHNDYQHDAADWLTQDHKFGGKRLIVSPLLAHLPELEVVEFNLAKTKSQRVAVGKDFPDNYYGLTTIGNKTVGTPFEAYSVGATFLVQIESQVIAVDKDVVSEVSAWAQQRIFAKDERFLTDAYARVNLAMRRLEIPDHEKANMLTAAVVLALQHASATVAAATGDFRDLGIDIDSKATDPLRPPWYDFLPDGKLKRLAAKVSLLLQRLDKPFSSLWDKVQPLISWTWKKGFRSFLPGLIVAVLFQKFTGERFASATLECPKVLSSIWYLMETCWKFAARCSPDRNEIWERIKNSSTALWNWLKKLSPFELVKRLWQAVKALRRPKDGCTTTDIEDDLRAEQLFNAEIADARRGTHVVPGMFRSVQQTQDEVRVFLATIMAVRPINATGYHDFTAAIPYVTAGPYTIPRSSLATVPQGGFFTALTPGSDEPSIVLRATRSSTQDTPRVEHPRCSRVGDPIGPSYVLPLVPPQSTLLPSEWVRLFSCGQQDGLDYAGTLQHADLMGGPDDNPPTGYSLDYTGPADDYWHDAYKWGYQYGKCFGMDTMRSSAPLVQIPGATPVAWPLAIDNDLRYHLWGVDDEKEVDDFLHQVDMNTDGQDKPRCLKSWLRHPKFPCTYEACQDDARPSDLGDLSDEVSDDESETDDEELDPMSFPYDSDDEDSVPDFVMDGPDASFSEEQADDPNIGLSLVGGPYTPANFGPVPDPVGKPIPKDSPERRVWEDVKPDPHEACVCGARTFYDCDCRLISLFSSTSEMDVGAMFGEGDDELADYMQTEENFFPSPPLSPFPLVHGTSFGEPPSLVPDEPLNLTPSPPQIHDYAPGMYVLGRESCKWDVPLPPLRADSYFKLPIMPEPCHERDIINLAFGFENIRLTQDTFCVHNEALGIAGRVLRPMPPSDPNFWGRVDFFGLTMNDTIAPAEFEQWAARYPVRKRRLLEEARDSATYIYDVRRSNKTLCHVKREMAYDVGKPKDPRIIQASTPECAYEMGRFTWASNRHMLRTNPHGHVTYGPGMTAELIDKWLWECEQLIKGPVSYGSLDIKRMDASTLKSSIVAYARSMDKAFGHPPSLQTVIERGGRLRGRSKNEIRYSTAHGVESGRNDTTDGNTQRSVVIVRLAIDDLPAYAIVSGDDCFLVFATSCKAELERRLRQQYAAAGYEIDLVFTDKRYAAEFCSGRFWPAGNTYGFAFGPKPGKLLPKLFATATPHPIYDQDAYRSSVCRGLANYCNHIPLASDYLAEVHRRSYTERELRGAAAQRRQRVMARIHRVSPQPVSSEIYDAFMDLYGIGRVEIDDFVRQIKTMSFGELVRGEWLKKLNHVDRRGTTPPRLATGMLTVFLTNFLTNFATSAGSMLLTVLLNRANVKLFGEEQATMIAPLVEETLRLANPIGYTISIIVGEALEQNRVGNTYGSLPAAFMHLICCFLMLTMGFLALPLCIAIHLGFNMFVLKSNTDRYARLVNDTAARLRPGMLKTNFFSQNTEKISSVFLADAKLKGNSLPTFSRFRPNTLSFHFAGRVSTDKLNYGTQNTTGDSYRYTSPILSMEKQKKGKAKQPGKKSTVRITVAAAKKVGGRQAKYMSRNRSMPVEPLALIQKQGGNRGKIARKGQNNGYLRTLIYPDRYTGIRYPDGYPRQTAVTKLWNEVFPPFFPSGATAEPAGDFYYIYRPSCVHPLWLYGTTAYATLGVPYWILNSDTDRWGLEYLNSSAPSPQEQSDQMWLPSGTTMNLRMPQCYTAGNFVVDPILATDTNGNNLFGYTFAAGTGNATFKFYATVQGNWNAADTLTVTAVSPQDPTGVSAQFTFAAQSNATSAPNCSATSGAMTALFTVSDAVLGTGQTANRANPIGFRITYNNVGGNAYGITLMNLQILPTWTTAPTNNLGLYPVDWRDQATILSVVTNYRTVSGSCWAAWEGSTLADGGNVAQVMYRGGGHPFQACSSTSATNGEANGIISWQGISMTPGGYEDKAKSGCYSFWVPVSDNDTLMRHPINAVEWNKPWIAGGGNIVANNSTGAGYSATPLRLRIVINIEFVTTSQLYHLADSLLNIAAILQAHRILHGAPTSMENDNHLETIYNWLKQAGQDVYDWGVRNRGWLIPAAQGIGTMIMAA